MSLGVGDNGEDGFEMGGVETMVKMGGVETMMKMGLRWRVRTLPRSCWCIVLHKSNKHQNWYFLHTFIRVDTAPNLLISIRE